MFSRYVGDATYKSCAFPFGHYLSLSEFLLTSSMLSEHCSVASCLSHRFTSFFFPSEMNGKLSEMRRAKLMDLKKREVEHGGTWNGERMWNMSSRDGLGQTLDRR